MALFYVSTCFKRVTISRIEYSFLSQQSEMSVCKRAGFLSLNRICGSGQRVTKQGPRSQQLWRRGRFWRRVMGVTPATGPTNIQRSRAQQFVFLSCFWWRVGQVNRPKHHPLRSGHGSLALTEMSYTPLEGAPGGKKATKGHIYNDGSSVPNIFLLFFCGYHHTAGDGD